MSSTKKSSKITKGQRINKNKIAKYKKTEPAKKEIKEIKTSKASKAASKADIEKEKNLKKIDLDEKITDLIEELEREPIDSEKDRRKDKKLFLYKYIIPITTILLLLSIIIITTPIITFKENNIKIRYNTNYVDKDYQAKSIIKDYTKKLKIKNNINTNKVGNYNIKYTLKYGLINITKTKNIEVIDDIKPEIKLNGNIEEIVCPNKEYEEKGYSAIDEYDGDLTKKVKINKKEKEIIYKVKDKAGNTSTIKRKITKGDKEPPKIELKDSNNINIYTGNNYTEPGYTATDNCDGDLTSKVEVSGSVNTNTVGTYKITYKVKDSHENETTVTRVVNVKNWSIIRPSGGGSGRGIVYLTFDDGPNEGTTNVILNILKEEGVQATFFVTCNGPDYLIKRMKDEGHVVALHTASHNYNYVYSSVSNYFADLDRVSNRVERITGEKSMIIRFPGGSSNTVSKRLSPGIMTTLTNEVRKRGYHYFDWNVDSNDAAGANTNQIYTNVVNGISPTRENVVLMHDVKATTRDAIRNIIRYGKQNGYAFRGITYDTVMVTHGVNN